jgi:trimethylamine--corrinoid protein Co-methyltransferase
MEMLVIADEIIRMTRFLMGGLPVNKETLALEAIARAEPGEGFLADDHTMDNFRTAQWAPKIIDRNQYDIWQAAGSKDMFTRANEYAKEILAEHKVPPLPEEAEKLIAEVLAERNAERG